MIPTRLCDLSVDELLAAVASDAPAPGGGAAAAVAGALAAALVGMAARLTIGRERYAECQDEMVNLRDRAEGLRRRLLQSADDDAAAYTSVMAAYRLPRQPDSAQAERKTAIQATMKRAIETQLDVATACVDLLDLAIQAALQSNRNAASDVAVAALLAHAGLQAALLNVRANLKSIEEESDRSAWHVRTEQLITAGERSFAEAMVAAQQRGE